MARLSRLRSSLPERKGEGDGEGGFEGEVRKEDGVGCGSGKGERAAEEGHMSWCGVTG